VLSAKKKDRNWELILKDLSKNPLKYNDKIIDGSSSKEDILKAFEYYGIKLNTLHLAPNTSKAKVLIEIWGSGKPMREFLYSDDMADACVYLMENIDFSDIISQKENNNKNCDIIEHKTKEIKNTYINIGTGKDICIKDLAYLIKDIIGYKGGFYFNTSKPDGTMRKVTDVSKLHSLGWKHSVELEDGIRKLYEWYINYNYKG
jgi:GDP-L-fucose synthase